MINSEAFSQELNVLVIGSSKSFSDGEEGAVVTGEEDAAVKEKAFNPSNIAVHLSSILVNDPTNSESVNVEFEDISKNKQYDTAVGSGASIWSLTYYCFSLAQHYMWPEGKAERMAKLRGEEPGGPAWDYIILCEDPYVMANFPGMYAEGVKLVQNEIAQSSNQEKPKLVLLAQWPENTSNFSANDFNEIVHRVGASGGIEVVPAGKTWNTFASQDSALSHPTPDGAYLAAASIYSKLYDKSAKTSTYEYVDSATTTGISDHALSVVQATAGVAQYSGKYTTSNPFQMSYIRKRTLEYNEYGTSTEDGFEKGMWDAFTSAKVAYSRRSGSPSNPVDFSFSRGDDNFEPDKQYDYQTRLDNDNHTFGHPMGDHSNTGAVSMIYGIDKRYNYWFYNGTDLGVAYSMIMEEQVPLNVRGLPIRLLWSKMNHANLGLSSHRDGWHLSYELDRAVGAYMFTTLTGRCPVEAEPADNTSVEWKRWWCRKLGYETAWQMAHLTTRAPGFRILPSATSATTVTPTTTETMTVQFVNPPQADVTVSVSISSPTAAIVGPKTLVFTPSNHGTPQEITVAGIPGASSSEPFEVVFSTSSDDETYDGLGDSWSYTNNRASTVSVSQVDNGTAPVIAPQNNSIQIDLNITGSNSGNTVFAGPVHGTITWISESVIEYSPDSDYVGTDQIVYAVTQNGTQTLGGIDISVEIPDGQVSVAATDATASEESPDTGTFVISRLGDTGSPVSVLFTLSGTATFGDDYTLSHTSPVTIPADQSSVTLTLTPVDDSVFSEGNETAILTIMEDAGYPIGTASAVIIISDNDNFAPSVDAGINQTASLDTANPWTPADISIAAWYDASDAVTITESGGVVSVWEDKTINARHATQSNSANRPVSGSKTIGGKNAIDFHAANSQSLNMPTVDLIGKEVWSVFFIDDYSTTNSHLLLGAGGNLQIGVNSGSQNLRLWAQTNPYSADTTSTATVPVSTPTVAGWLTHTDTKKFSINGVLETTTNTYVSPRTLNATYIGRGQYANMDGAIGEIIITSGTLSTDDRQIMEGYLAHKWSLANNLPLNHPHQVQSPGGSIVEVNLNGDVTDADGQIPTTFWTKISGPGSVNFTDPTAVDTTVTFSEAGTYVLRLTADDGTDQAFDELTITVSEQQNFTDWIDSFNGLGELTAFGDDADGDGLKNGIENYFGTHPGEASQGLVAQSLSSNTFTFTHPLNGSPATNISASYRWSKDLSGFQADGATHEGTTVNFTQSEPIDGMVTIQATITGTALERLFVDLVVTEDSP